MPPILVRGALPPVALPRLDAPPPAPAALPYPLSSGPPLLATDEGQELPGALEFVAQLRRTFLSWRDDD